MKRRVLVWLALVAVLAAGVLPGMGFAAVETGAVPTETVVGPTETDDESTHFPLGDINCDGTVNIEDIVYVSGIITGRVIPEERNIDQLKRINSHGRATIGTVFKIRKEFTDMPEDNYITNIDAIDIKISSPDAEGNQRITILLTDYNVFDYSGQVCIYIGTPFNMNSYIIQEKSIAPVAYHDFYNEFILYGVSKSGNALLASITVKSSNGKPFTAKDFPITCVELFTDSIFQPKSPTLFDPATSIWLYGPGAPAGSSMSVRWQSRAYLPDYAQESLRQVDALICDIDLSSAKQTNGNVTVYIPVPKDFFAEACSIFRVDDESLTNMNATIEADYLVFKTDTLGTFVTTLPTKGDIDRDFRVTISDILRLRDIIFGDKPITDYILWAADATEPTDISIKTILNIRDIIFGI